MPKQLSEFVIWGYAPGADAEALLVSEHAGLRDLAHAEAIAQKLEVEHGCNRMRIQHLEPLGDGSELAAMFQGGAR